MNTIQAYIGKALEYPLKVANGAGRIITGTDVIEASYTQIFGTQKGELAGNPEFGCNINRLIGEPLADLAINLGRTYMIEAAREWEGRARIEDIQGSIGQLVQDGQTKAIINFSVTYRILASNQINTFVYPFYRGLES